MVQSRIHYVFSLEIEYHDRPHSTARRTECTFAIHCTAMHKTCAAIRGNSRESTAERAQTSGVANGFDRLEM